MKKLLISLLTLVMVMSLVPTQSLSVLKAESELVSREFKKYKFNLTMTNEFLPKDPMNGRPNVQAVIQQQSYESLFNGSKTDREFEFLWDSGMDHIVMPKYVTLPITLHYKLRKADILNKVVVCNAPKGNGYMSAVQVDLFYDDGTKVTKVIDTMQQDYVFEFDSYDLVKQVDITILSAVNYSNEPVTTQMTISEIDLIKVVPKEMATIDKDELALYVDDVKKTDFSSCSEESYSVFIDALIEAESLLSNDNATQEQLDAAVVALENAYNSLEIIPAPVVDKSALQEVVDEYEGIDANQYTPDSYTRYMESHQKAKAVLADANASQAEVDEALCLLLEKVGDLVKVETPTVTITKKDDLKAKVDQLKNIQQDDYTDQSYAQFIDALEHAKEILASNAISQDDVDNALVALKNAYALLVEEKLLPFKDVYVSEWYYDIINDVYQLGLMSGATETLFKPNAKMNRGMVAIVFHRMDGSVDTEYESLFKDVAKGQYYSESVIWAKKNGVINGYNDGTFKPLKNITREEMAQMLYNFAKYKGIDVKSNADLSQFDDSNKISSYHKDALKWAVANGLISGKDNGKRVDPLGHATRAECSKMLLNGYKAIYK